MAFVGIDLGTTTSEVAVYKNKQPKTIIDSHGNDIIPSVVAFDNKTKILTIGEKAKSILVSNKDLVAQEIKRVMGQNVDISLGDQNYRPQEISAFILRHLKKIAEDFLGETVDRAVITVPANFNDKQRNATVEAGEIAGLKIERIINEPTAAALAYGHSSGLDEEIVMVYDLGGGTFDVSIVEYIGDCLDVLASSGDNHLGGKDFDRLLTEFVIAEFEKNESIKIKTNTAEYFRLLLACEEAKKELSFSLATTINIPFFAIRDGSPVNLEIEITRTQFENLIRPLIDRTEKAMKLALKDSGKTIQEISKVLLVGGSTRIPYVKKIIASVMGRSPLSDIDPDRAVALGAAIQTAIIDGSSQQIIMDVCPLSFGTVVSISVQDVLIPGYYSEILPANSKVLIPKEDEFVTLFDNQDSVNLRVYQRESLSGFEWAEVEGAENSEAGFTLLGSKEIENIPPNKAGMESIRVSFSYNQNGLLDIEATVVSTNQKTKFQVSSKLDSNQIQDSKAKVDKVYTDSEYFDRVKSTIHVAEKKIQEGLNLPESNQINSLIQKLKEALANNNLELIEKYDEEITGILFNLD